MTRSIMRLVPLLGILMLAFGLRVWLLNDLNLNWDEGYSAWMVRLPIPDLLDTTARDVHPPLYYLLLRANRALMGEGEFALRYGSVLLGVLTVALTFGFGRAVGGYTTGVFAALLVALARGNVHISQLTRMHILAMALSTGALWATVRVWRNPRDWRAGAAYVLCVAGALYTFYLTIMLPLATNAAFLLVWWRNRDDRRLFWTWVGVQVTAAALFAPWAWYASQRMFGWSSDEITPVLFFVQYYFSTLVVGFPRFDAAQLPWVFASLSVIGAGLIAIFHTRSNTQTRLMGLLANLPTASRGSTTSGFVAARLAVSRAKIDDHSSSPTTSLMLLLSGILTPAVVVFLLSLPFHDLGRPLAARYLIMLSACFYVLAAWGVTSLTMWRQPAGIVGGLVLLVVPVYGLHNIADGAIRRDDMISIARLLEAQRFPDDALVLHNDRTWTTLAAHYAGDYFPVRQGEDVTDGYANFVLEPLWAESPALWLITTPDALVNDPDGRVTAWLEERAVASKAWTFGDHTLAVYAKTEARAATLNNLVPGSEPSQETDQIFVEQPIQRFAVGDRLNFAVYWSSPPDDPVTITLVDDPGIATPCCAFPFEVEAPSLATDGPTRQQFNLLLTPDMPPGRYAIYWDTETDRVQLGDFSLVRFVETGQVREDQIDQRVDALFGEHISLLGYDMASSSTVAAGGTVDVTLYWQAQQVLDTRYKVGVFVQGEAFNPETGTPLWAQVDAEPRNWALPTTQWQPGAIIEDRYTLALSERTPPGETYTLGVVLYNTLTGERLPVHDSADNTVALAQLRVTQSGQ